MLAARSVLREQARPCLRVGRHLDVGVLGTLCVVAPAVESVHPTAGIDHADRGFARVDDARVPEIEIHPQPVHVAAMRRDATVAQVQAEQVDVGRRKLREAVSECATGAARGPSSRRSQRDATGEPIADGGTRDSSSTRYLRRVQAVRLQVEDSRYLFRRAHLTNSVRAEGLEPTRSSEQPVLNRSCLPDSSTPAWALNPSREELLNEAAIATNTCSQ
jgi:hypothetical protein